jgi:hypothetical protein
MADEQMNPTEIKAIRSDMSEMRRDMSEMAKALTRLTLLEERHAAFNALLTKIAERQESADAKRHEADLVAAKNSDIPTRVASIETVIRDMHIERQEDKARFNTFVWMTRALWTVATSGLGLGLLQFFANKT